MLRMAYRNFIETLGILYTASKLQVMNLLTGHTLAETCQFN